MAKKGQTDQLPFKIPQHALRTRKIIRCARKMVAPDEGHNRTIDIMQLTKPSVKFQKTLPQNKFRNTFRFFNESRNINQESFRTTHFIKHEQSQAISNEEYQQLERAQKTRNILSDARLFLKEQECQEKVVFDILQQLKKKELSKKEQLSINERIQELKIIDPYFGKCVICLVGKSFVFMEKCRHLVCCRECSTLLAAGKCPLCRTEGDMQDITEVPSRPV